MSAPVAFIAGATGYTGSHLVDVLRERGWEVYAHVRPDSSSLETWRARFEAAGAHVDTTPWNDDAMQQAFARIQPTHVFGLLGTTRSRAKGPASAVEDTYHAVDYGLTAIVRRATEHAAPHARFIYLSSIGVTPTSTNPYLKARALLEGELHAGPLDWVIIRPAMIHGADRPEHRLGEQISNTLISGALGLVGIFSPKTKSTYQTRDGRLLAEGIADAAERAPKGSILAGDGLDALAHASV